MHSPLRGIAWESCLGTAVGLVTLAVMLATLGDPGMAWDEGFTVERERKVREWFSRVISPRFPYTARAELFQERVLTRYWPFSREEPDGHPPFYAIIGLLGWVISHRWVPPLEAYRLGPALLFSFTVAVWFLFTARRWGLLAGLAAAGSWFLMPRVFAHAHFASYDIPLACLWLLSVVTFWKAREGWAVSLRAGRTWSIIFALVLSLAFSTKFTGWLIPLPLMVWSVAAGAGGLVRQRSGSVRELIPLAVVLAPLLLAAPDVVGLWRVLGDTDAALDMPQQDGRARAAQAAELVRSRESGDVPAVVVLLPALIWSGVLGLRRLRTSSRTVSEVRPLVEIWTTAAAIAPPITFALNPPWWHDPARGFAIFLWSNLSRQGTTWIPTQFFGTTYDFALPWYNTLAWIGLTVPPMILLLVLLGVAHVLWNRTVDEPEPKQPGCSEQPGCWNRLGLGWLLLLNAATLLVIRALPGAPGHDGVRQLLGAFPFLAGLAGVGVESLRRWAQALVSGILGTLAAWCLLAAALVWAAAATWHYHPVQLSYYSELIGGLPGAERLGLEPTYYWDALDDQMLRWLNDHTKVGEKVLFQTVPDSFQCLRRWGRLKVSYLPWEQGAWRWYVLQNRPGQFRPRDRWLAKYGQPACPPRAQDGVPLIWIFPIEEYENAVEKAEPSG